MKKISLAMTGGFTRIELPSTRICLLRQTRPVSWLKNLATITTSTGDILDQSDPAHRKQERHARLWGYNRAVGLSGIIHGYRKHCRNQHELAECLHVSEEYLQEAIACYRDKYGCSVEVDGYLIVFEPCLAVYERFEDTEN